MSKTETTKRGDVKRWNDLDRTARAVFIKSVPPQNPLVCLYPESSDHGHDDPVDCVFAGWEEVA